MYAFIYTTRRHRFWLEKGTIFSAENPMEMLHFMFATKNNYYYYMSGPHLYCSNHHRYYYVLQQFGVWWIGFFDWLKCMRANVSILLYVSRLPLFSFCWWHTPANKSRDTQFITIYGLWMPILLLPLDSIFAYLRSRRIVAADENDIETSYFNTQLRFFIHHPKLRGKSGLREGERENGRTTFTNQS